MTQKEIDKIIDALPYAGCYGDGKAEFVLTGTFLLTMFGLMDEYNDVDVIVVNANRKFWSDFLNEHEDSLIEASEFYDCVKIELSGITFNLIQDDRYYIASDSMNLFVDDNVYLDSLSHALKVKADLKREKDKVHFEIINQRLEDLKKNEKDNV